MAVVDLGNQNLKSHLDRLVIAGLGFGQKNLKRYLDMYCFVLTVEVVSVAVFDFLFLFLILLQVLSLLFLL